MAMGPRWRILGIQLAALGALAGLALTLGGCSGEESGSAPASMTATVAATPAGSPAPAVGSFGQVLTDAAGITLYTFTADTAGTTASACNAACAAAWPPVITTAAALTKPVGAPAELGVVTRADGARQVTYGGRPLYRFSGDSTPGEAKGQGINSFGGVWVVA